MTYPKPYKTLPYKGLIAGAVFFTISQMLTAFLVLFLNNPIILYLTPINLVIGMLIGMTITMYEKK